MRSPLMKCVLLSGLMVAAPPSVVAQPARRSGAAPRAKVQRRTLAQLEGLVRKHSPAVLAARAKVKSAQTALLKAKLLWVPTAKMTFSFAPAPRVSCLVPQAFENVQMSDGSNLYATMNAQREKYCMGTDTSDDVRDFIKNYDPTSYWFRFEASVIQPLYTFGKIRNAKRLARQGVAAQQIRVRVARDDAVRDVRRAYFGLKLARELLFEIDEGWKYLRKAQKRIAKQLAADSDDVDTVDKYRLDLLVIEVKDQVLQLKRAERLALGALRALIGRRAPKNLDVDKKPLTRVKAQVKSLKHYLRLARTHRPELRLLGVAIKASKAVVSLRKTMFAPDLAFVLKLRATASSSKDNPSSAYARDALHGTGLYLGLALRWNLDFHFKYTALSQAQSELLAVTHLRERATLGVELQIEKGHDELVTAGKRLTLLQKARKTARKWLITMSQRHDLGTADTKKLTDAVKAYFQTQLKVHRAVYELNLAAVNLSRAVGVDVTKSWSHKNRK
jgi:outer membrane protein TolC